MIAEITVTPLGEGTHIAQAVADVVKVVADSGLSFQVTALGTIVEGDADRIWEVARRCHEKASGAHERVITELRIDDTAGESGALRADVAEIEQILGRELPTGALGR